jgi:hypothetical protein
VDREAGLAEMSRKFRAMGGEVYVEVEAETAKDGNKTLG